MLQTAWLREKVAISPQKRGIVLLVTVVFSLFVNLKHLLDLFLLFPFKAVRIWCAQAIAIITKLRIMSRLPTYWSSMYISTLNPSSDMSMIYTLLWMVSDPKFY